MDEISEEEDDGFDYGDSSSEDEYSSDEDEDSGHRNMLVAIEKFRTLTTND